MMPASRFTRIAYCFSVVVVMLMVFTQIQFALLLIAQTSQNSNVVNPISAALTLTTSALFIAVCGYRIWGIASGRFRLAYPPVGKWLNITRIAGLCFMVGGLIVLLLTLAGMVATGIGAIAIVGGMFRFMVPVGLALFEISRLIGFEENSERAT